MISTGIDIEDVNRFKNKSLEEDRKFLNRIFTQDEINYCYSKIDYYRSLTARFCAKEAFIKAVSNLYSGFISYSDIEIIKNSNGSVSIKTNIDIIKDLKCSLSISHEKDKAIAIVVIEY